MIVRSTVPVPEIALLSDDAGRFSMRLPPGQFTLQAYGDDGLMGEANLDVTATIHTVDIKVGQ